MAPFIYTPAWAYRFILKSTLWFWWVLFIVGGAPRLDGGIDGLRADAYRKASGWIGIATALFAFVGFGLGWLLKPLAENVAAQAKLPTAVALLVLVDWTSVPVVQVITLASVAATFFVLILDSERLCRLPEPADAGCVSKAMDVAWLPGQPELGSELSASPS